MSDPSTENSDLELRVAQLEAQLALLQNQLWALQAAHMPYGAPVPPFEVTCGSSSWSEGVSPDSIDEIAQLTAADPHLSFSINGDDN